MASFVSIISADGNAYNGASAKRVMHGRIKLDKTSSPFGGLVPPKPSRGFDILFLSICD